MTLERLSAWRVAAVAVAAGMLVGAAGAALRRTTPWSIGELGIPGADVSGPAPRAAAPETRHTFGTIGTGATGSHEFVVENSGNAPLTLRKGTTSCTCTVADFDAATGGAPDGTKEVAPGETARIRVQWQGKPPGGPFRQQATVLTDDPRRPEIVFTVEGTVVPTWRAEPDLIALPRLSASSGERATADVFTYGTEPPSVQEAVVDDPEVAPLVSLATEPLPADTIAAATGATGGFRLTVDVKPGLPIGPLREVVRVSFTMPEPFVAEIPLEGTVGGDLVMAGPGWDSARQALLLGTVSGKTGLRTRVFLTAKGPHRESVRPTVREVVPESLQVTVGEGSPIGTGGVVRIPIDIVVPPGSRAVNHLCSQQGPAGRIVLVTGHPDSPEFTIPVCVAVGP
ncbi:MAG: DUF1573 domain-containing protein [Planctomycetes bacterium]|nr:DUF1573 domain-containing protein [Planctomycetota bacterium]